MFAMFFVGQGKLGNRVHPAAKRFVDILAQVGAASP